MIDPLLEPEFAVADRSEHYRPQNYRAEWENNPLFKDWITKGVSSKRARCKVCDMEMTADICVIKSHGRGIKHLRRLRGDIPESDLKVKCTTYNHKWEAEDEYKGWLQAGRVPFKAECKLCDVEFRAEKTVLRNHAKSRRHQRSESHARRVKEAAQMWAADRSPLRVPATGRSQSDSDNDDPGDEYPENSLSDAPLTEKQLLTERLLSEEQLTKRITISEEEINKRPTLSREQLTKRITISEEEISKRPTLSREQLTKRLSSFIVNGYQKLKAKCPDCQSPLLRDKEGTRLCAVCTDTTNDNLLLDDTDEEEDAGGADNPESLTAEEDTNDFFSHDSNNDFNTAKVEIEIEGKPCSFSDEDEEAFTVFRMVQEDGEAEEAVNRCIIQGQDMSVEVHQLVQALLGSVRSLTAQVSTGHDTQVALGRLDKIVGLLNKLKEL